jgi:hypothetical protein
MNHWKQEWKGKGPERKIVYSESEETKPAKISMGEKVKIVELLVESLRREYHGCEIIYERLLPSHIESCCNENELMDSEVYSQSYRYK